MAGKRSGARTFDPIGTLPPSAGAPATTPIPESAPESPKTPSTRSSSKTSRRHDVKTSKPSQRLAYTWRLTRDQADQLDRLTLAVRDAAGRVRLDRAEMLAALLDQLDDDSAYARKIARRLSETS